VESRSVYPELEELSEFSERIVVIVMFCLVDALEQKLAEGDYSMDKETMEEVVKMLRHDEKLIERLESLNERLRMREKSMWDIDDVARYLEVTNQTVYNMIRDKRIKAYKVGREWRFHPSDIVRHVAQGCNIQEE
jgi:excisionase family DNA binding protein